VQNRFPGYPAGVTGRAWRWLGLLVGVGTSLLVAPVAQAETWSMSAPRYAVRTADGSIVVSDGNVVRRLRGESEEPLVVAGSGRTGGFGGDGGPATAASLSLPDGLAALPGGGFLIADQSNFRIRRVAPDGTITTVAGGGLGGPGCLARNISLYSPRRVSPMGDGGFLVVTGEDDVLRVWPNGSVTEIASELWLFDVADAKPMPDGSILVADRNEVFRVAPDGAATRLAGSDEEYGDTGDDGPATAARFEHISGLAPLAGGGYMVLDGSRSGRLRRVRSDGVIEAYGNEAISYGEGLSADPLGGLLYTVQSDPRKVVRHVDPEIRPAPLPAPAPGGTDGYAGTCAGLDPAFAGGVVAPRVGRDVSRGPAGVVALPDGRLVYAATYAGTAGRADIGLAAVKADGTTDREFGKDGFALPAIADRDTWASGIVVQSSGRIVVAGVARDPDDTLLAGIRPDGSLDPSFGDGGVVRTGLTDREPRIMVGPGDALTVSAAGELLRLEPNGAPDEAFGDHGRVRTDAAYTAIAAGSNGSIVTLTELGDVARWHADGRRDTGFAPAALDSNPGMRWGALALAPDGKVTLAGATGSSATIGSVVRLLADGRRDGSFGAGGTVPVSGVWGLSTVLLDGDDTVVLGGSDTRPRRHLALRLSGDGTPDGRFGEGGHAVTEIYGGTMFSGGVMLPDGRFAATGSSGFTVASRASAPSAPPRRSRTGVRTRPPPAAPS
jgi:uncharacterized delta-60 repeat protein